MEWYALRVRSNHEKIVAEQLRGRSLDEYVPLYRSTRRWSDRVKVISLPLFPGYVFARFAVQERMTVLKISSVVSVVGFGGVPYPLTEDEISQIRNIVGSGLTVAPWAVLHVGQRVRVKDGPLAGLEGIFVKEKTASRVVVNVDLLQRGVAVEIEYDQLEALRN